ncbi:MAG: MFS transporter [Paraclostridium sp.]
MNLYSNLINEFKICNIKRLYLYGLFANIFFDRALWTIYLNNNGISITQIGLVESILHLAIFLFEIPTGIISDIYGRKVSLIISRLSVIFYSIGMIFFATNIFSLILTFIILGISETLESGSDTSLLYDSIDGDKSHKEKIFVKINSRYGAICTIGISLGMFFGGLLKLISWKSIYIALIVVQFISIFSLLHIEENINVKKVHKETLFLDSLKSIWNDVKSVIRQKKFITLCLGSIFFTSVTNTIYIFTPIILNQVNVQETTISMVFSISSLLSILIYFYVGSISEKINIIKSIKFITLIMISSTILFPIVGEFGMISIFIVIKSISCVFYILSDTLINNIAEKGCRTTILSTVSFTNSLLMMILFLVSGFLINNSQVKVIFFIFSLFGILSFMCLVKFNKINKNRDEV